MKEEREAKRAQLDERHGYIMVTVADCLGIERNDVEDALLEGTQIDTMNKFLVADGHTHLIFFYQDVESEKDAGN